MTRQEQTNFQVMQYEFGEYICGRGLTNDWGKGLTFNAFCDKYKIEIINGRSDKIIVKTYNYFNYIIEKVLLNNNEIIYRIKDHAGFVAKNLSDIKNKVKSLNTWEIYQQKVMDKFNELKSNTKTRILYPSDSQLLTHCEYIINNQ